MSMTKSRVTSWHHAAVMEERACLSCYLSYVEPYLDEHSRVRVICKDCRCDLTQSPAPPLPSGGDLQSSSNQDCESPASGGQSEDGSGQFQTEDSLHANHDHTEDLVNYKHSSGSCSTAESDSAPESCEQ